jgi:hypothetical protein
MIANNDFGSIYVQKSNGTNSTSAVAGSQAPQVPVAAPQVAKQSASAKLEAQAKNISDAAAVVAANEAALEANAKNDKTQRSPANAQETVSGGISIETSKLDDSNFDNLGKSLDNGKTPDEIKKEVTTIAD